MPANQAFTRRATHSPSSSGRSWPALGRGMKSARQPSRAIRAHHAIVSAGEEQQGGAGAASVLAWVLARQVFDLPHSPDPCIWLFGLGGGVGLVLTAGWLATRDLLDEPPLKALRME